MPSTQPLAIAVLAAHAPTGRAGAAVAAWVLDRAGHRRELAVDPLVVADLDLPWDLPQGDDPRVAALRRRIEVADGVLVVVPEYNHSFPGNLKHTIDLVRSEWARRPVGFVSYGGISGGLRAVEQLRLVFAELRAVTLRDTVSFAHAGEHVVDGRLRATPAAERAATTLLDDLVWWGELLRDARAAGERAA